MTREAWRQQYREARAFARIFPAWAAEVARRCDGAVWRGRRIVGERVTVVSYGARQGLTVRRGIEGRAE